jgi:chorismate mutase/prephenate dehydratase
VTDGISDAREAIDAIDVSLLASVNRRVELVRALHEHKRATGIPLRDPGREDAMIAGLQSRNEGPLSDEGVAELVQFVLGLTRKELYGGP